MQNAGRVGLLVVVFGAMLFGAYQFLGRSILAQKTYKVYATFEDVGGINAGAKVLMAGVKIGQVEKVELAGPAKARLTLSIESDKKIPEGSTAILATSLIGIGDNPVQITAPKKATSSYLAEGGEIAGRKLGALEGIVPDLEPTLNEVNKTLASVRDIVEDREIRDQLIAVLGQTSRTLNEFGTLAASANSALSENRSTIQSTLKTFAFAMKDVQRSARMAADLLGDPKYRDQASEILASLTSTAKRADQMMASVQDIVGDPKLKTTLDETLVGTKTMVDTGNRIASNAEKMTESGTKIAENGVTISENVVELTAKANKLADEAKEVFEKIKGFFERAPGTSNLSKLETEMSLHREFDKGVFRTDVLAKYPIPGGKINVGMFDAFESNNLIAQLQRPLSSKLDYRYGIYGGQPGVGVDYSVSPRLKLQGDLFGLNDPRFDLKARVDFGSDFLGWLSLNRIANGNVFSIGVGIKR